MDKDEKRKMVQDSRETKKKRLFDEAMELAEESGIEIILSMPEESFCSGRTSCIWHDGGETPVATLSKDGKEWFLDISGETYGVIFAGYGIEDDIVFRNDFSKKADAYVKDDGMLEEMERRGSFNVEDWNWVTLRCEGFENDDTVIGDDITDALLDAVRKIAGK